MSAPDGVAASDHQTKPHWRPMSESPPLPGRYIVAHRGGIGGDAYYNAPGVPGWSQLPDFRPSHWCAAPEGTR